MRQDMDRHVQAAGWPAPWPHLALVREPDLVSLVDPRGDRHPERALALRSAVAATRLAGGLDDFALATAARAGTHVDHLAEHRLADRADLAAAAALWARR